MASITVKVNAAAVVYHTSQTTRPFNSSNSSLYAMLSVPFLHIFLWRSVRFIYYYFPAFTSHSFSSLFFPVFTSIPLFPFPSLVPPFHCSYYYFLSSLPLYLTSPTISSVLSSTLFYTSPFFRITLFFTRIPCGPYPSLPPPPPRRRGPCYRWRPGGSSLPGSFTDTDWGCLYCFQFCHGVGKRAFCVLPKMITAGFRNVG